MLPRSFPADPITSEPSDPNNVLNFCRGLTPAERSQRTTDVLAESVALQEACLRHAILWRTGFERWICGLLRRLWMQYVRYPAEADSKTFVWSDAFARQRTKDLYFGAEGKLRNRGCTELSGRALHLEIWFARYLWFFYGAQDDTKILQVLSRELGDFAGLTLVYKRLSGLAAKEGKTWGAKTSNPVPVIARGLVELLAFQYVATLADASARESTRKFIVKNVRGCMDLHAQLPLLNAPALCVYVRRYATRAAHCCMSRDDCIRFAEATMVSYAGQFNPHLGYTFAAPFLRVLTTAFRRELDQTSLIAVPENVRHEVAKLAAWRARNPELAAALSLDDQLQQVGLKLSASEFLEKERLLQGADTVSVDVLLQGEDGTVDAASHAANMTTDRGRGAETIRTAAEGSDGTMAETILRRAFERLPALSRCLLECFAPCNATRGGQLAWLSSLVDKNTALLVASNERVRTGVASQSFVARRVRVVYA